MSESAVTKRIPNTQICKYFIIYRVDLYSSEET